MYFSFSLYLRVEIFQDDSSGDESPSSVAIHSEMDDGSTPILEAYLHSNGFANNDVQRRRERHIALLDSIVEEEELEDISSSEPFESSQVPPPLVRIVKMFRGTHFFFYNRQQNSHIPLHPG